MEVDDREPGELPDSPPESEAHENNQLVDMDIESPASEHANNQVSIEDEAESLRQLLLEQMKTKRLAQLPQPSSTPKTNTQPPTPSSASRRVLTTRPSANTTLTQASTPNAPTVNSPASGPNAMPLRQTTTVFITPPPLFPPGHASNNEPVLLPPPPNPPPFMRNNIHNASQLGPSFRPLPATGHQSTQLFTPIFPERPPSVPANSTQQQQVDTPRSPDQIPDPELANLFALSDDSISDGEFNFDLDLDEVKKDNRGKKKEISRLFRRQKENETEYHDTKVSIERVKNELAELEKKLTRHAEKGMEINERIKSIIDRHFSAESERLSKLGTERTKFKTALAHRSNRLKETRTRLKKGAALLAVQPRLQPKVIPLNPITTPAPNRINVELHYTPNAGTRQLFEKTKAGPSTPVAPSPLQPVTRDETAPKKSPFSIQQPPPSIPNKHQPRTARKTLQPATNSKQSAKSSKKQKSKSSTSDKRLDNLASKLNISQIVGHAGQTNANEAEAELRRKLASKLSQKKTDNKDAANDRTSPVDNEEPVHVEDPIHNSPATWSAPFNFQRDANFPQCSRFASVEDAVKNPLVNLRSYRISSSFPFEHISHPALSNHVKVDPPICPFELHGICADPSCKFQHLDKDLRVSDEEIIREIIGFAPQLCPKGATPDELARQLLKMNSVDFVARLLASAIPNDVRNRCFSEELRKLTVSGMDDQ